MKIIEMYEKCHKCGHFKPEKITCPNCRNLAGAVAVERRELLAWLDKRGVSYVATKNDILKYIAEREAETKMIASIYDCSAWRVPESAVCALFVDLEADEEKELVKFGFVCEAKGRSVDPGEWFRMWVETHTGDSELATVHTTDEATLKSELLKRLPKNPVHMRRPRKDRLE